MKRIGTIALGVIATLGPVGAAFGVQDGSAPVAGQAISARPMSGTAATIAAGDVTVVAWLEDSGATHRVVGTAGAATSMVRLGPDGAGIDGAPTSAVTSAGSVWVVASRDSGATQRLWTHRWADGAWQEPISGPRARPYDHHPAIAAVGGSEQMWMAWLGEDGVDRDATMLYASRWTGSRWTAAEPLPRAPGIPMAPSITVDATGTPVVAWAASDGNDAEIWASARRGGRWSTPVALSRNQVPDITPSISSAPVGLLVTWISYADNGYLPWAITASAIDGWTSPVRLSDSPGSRPRAAVVNGKPAVFWRRLEFMPAGGTITSRVLVETGWAEPVPLVAASGSPFNVANALDGRLMLAFSRPGGQLGVAESDRVLSRDDLDSLATVSRARFGAVTAGGPTPAPTVDDIAPIVPENYTAFGDSITNGVVYDPVRRTSAGYRDPLQQMLRAFFRLGTVFNAGVDGESTADGLGRIDNAIRAQKTDVILVMEGANDILDVVDVATIAFNLRRMVQRSFEEDPDILPFLAQLPPRLDPGPEGFDGPGNGRIDELNALLPAIGEEEGAGIVDMNTPLDGNPELMSNPLHPSVAGYELMAVQWYDAIRPVVLDRTNRGDVDGSGRTDGLDLVRLALAFGSLAGEDRYNAAADINDDGIVDGFDLGLLIEFFGQHVAAAEEGS